ncbi:MAG: GTP-binding protein [Acidobacteria bacterium]|jgi:small GTP-binding protein|nr:MAG: GTP-binding protein [Acidobacteriota bacterium]
MLEPILNDEQRELLSQERELLDDVKIALERCETSADDLKALADSVRQLDELFLLVVVGEFNAGKSALINALLGREVLAEGVTPTTSKIHQIVWGEKVAREPMGAVGECITAPVETLRLLTIVDTPGTNALDRAHEALTTDYVPRADLVLFVTSADRPLSESERVFLEAIREWGKKVAMVVNKIDILRSEDEVAEVVAYVSENAKGLLGVDPEVFGVSALNAVEAQGEEAVKASGLPAVESFLRGTLDSGELLRLKLGNPVGVASHLLGGALETVSDRLELVADDLQTLDDIERQTETWADDVRREFELRLSDIDNLLHLMEQRGMEFFDETVRIARLPKLFDKSALKARFESDVVADAPESVEAKVESLIDWLVDSELGHWQNVVNHVNRRVVAHADRMVGEVGGRFEADRTRLLETVGRAARDGLASYDRTREAQRMAEDLQKAVTSTAVLEVGAVGLGAAVALAASSTAADITGLTAAGLMAALGLFVLPHRRRRAKSELKRKIAILRQELMAALTTHFDREAESGRRRLEKAIAPYTRFVRSESERLNGDKDSLSALSERIGEMTARVSALSS